MDRMAAPFWRAHCGVQRRGPRSCYQKAERIVCSRGSLGRVPHLAVEWRQELEFAGAQALSEDQDEGMANACLS
jgi:hypothetical protein